MDTSTSYRPRVSRETRLLLIAGLIAIAALWVLARVRFPDRPVTPNPVPPVLSQIASGPKYGDLAAEIGQLQARLQPSLLSLDVATVPPVPGQPPRRGSGLRLRHDLVVTWIPMASNGRQSSAASLLGLDAASGLAIVRVSSPAASLPPVPWTPRQPQQPRFLAASYAAPEGVSLQPVFFATLDPIHSALWADPIWAVPGQTDVTPGSFLFTNDAELAGLVIAYGDRLAIVPGAAVLAEAEKLVAAPPGPSGSVGIEVQRLTSSVASVTGALSGVVVTWVDPDGAARDQLIPGEVIEAVDGVPVADRHFWDVRAARLVPGQTLTLRVRRLAGTREVVLVARTRPEQTTPRTPGLVLRAVSTIGVEVLRVMPGSAGERAGLAPGDLITLIADIPVPTPTQVLRTFTSLRQGQRVLVAVTRGDAHFVTTLDR